MKKIYAAIFLLLISFGANAQCSPDNSLNQPGYSPDFLDTAFTGQNYNMVVSIRIPSDTTVSFGGQTITADIDSIRLVNVVGLPTGFTYVCNVNNCLFKPMQTYCAKLTGAPTSTQAGVYPLRFAIVSYASAVFFGNRTSFPPQADTLDQFDLIVKDQGNPNGVGVYTYAYKFAALRIYPNPTKLNCAIVISGEAGETANYQISDITGKVYHSESVLLTDGEKQINYPTTGLAKGIYFVRLQTQKGIFTQRLVIEN